ncbi:MAG: cellulose binding domain-containing protein [Terracidiphilus sp.]
MKHNFLRACGTVLATAIVLASTAAAQTACKVVYTISPQNSSAFGAGITIDNTGTTAWTSWTLTWAFANGQTITSLWNGTETQSGANVTVKNLSYNGSVPAGGNISGIGFNGTWNGTTNAVPTSFAVNGTTCGTSTGSFSLKPSASTLSLAQGASATDTINVIDSGSFAGPVTLAASGLPSGVTATFGTNPATGSSVLTLTAGSSTSCVVGGASTITITGTSGVLSATTTITLTVTAPVPGYTIAPSASTLTLPQGGNVTDTISTTVLTGFTGSVTLAATGLPSGVTASWSANPTTANSVLTLTASSTATVGAATITITGKSGCMSVSTTIALTVTQGGGFTLTPSASILAIGLGSCAVTDTITVTDISPFNGSVTLAASGLPSGVAATFGTNPTTGSSVLTLTAGSTAIVGTYPITITGVSGSQKATTSIALTVVASAPDTFTLTASPAVLSITEGSSGSVTITPTESACFAGTVTLAVSGLPSGVTATFSANPTTGSSVMTLKATSSVAVGTYNITITGTSGALTVSTTLSLTVTPPTKTGFGCSILYTVTAQSPTTFGGAFTIGNTGTTAWTSWTLTWAFANGQTISSFWNGLETQSGGNVTVASESYNGAVAPGAFATNIGFNGIWNGVTNQIPTSFAINGTVCSAPAQASGSFSLAASASSLAITQGGSGTDTITITDVSPFSGSLTLSAAGLPAGVTAVFGTNPATTTSVLTLTASSTAAVGTSTLTISGTNPTGTLVSSTPIALTVSLPVPVISWLSPASGIAGSSVTIMPGGALGDASFGATQGTSAVYFGSTAATVTGWAANSVAVTVPSLAAGTVNVTVVVNGQTSAAVPFTVTSTAPSPETYTGNSTWFSALGTPYGGCGVPQQYLDSQNFVALNVQNDPADYTLFLSRPIASEYASEIGLWDNGMNCGRWVHVTIGDFCDGMNDGEQDEPFCRGGTGWVADQFTGAELDLVVADSCQDGNAWCRDDPYHLDQAEAALNQYVLNGAAVGDMNPTYWNNRQIHWNFELPPSYTGDINIGMLANSTSAWTAISVTHLANGIHGLQYLSGGVWTKAINDGDMGEAFLISPTVAGGTEFEVQVYDITNTLINNARIYSFAIPASCGSVCTPAFTPVTYTTSQ